MEGTQLSGSYDITLDAADGPSIFTALEGQLGLKLQTTKASVDVFVVDSVTAPEPD